MKHATLDIGGLYDWDNTIFDNCVFPSDVNKSELIDMLIVDCRELCVSIISPSVMKRALELWTKKNAYYWSQLQETMHYDYDPISNYDKHSEITDTYNNSGNNKETGNRTIARSGSDTTNDKLSVTAYNGTTYVTTPREEHNITHTPNTTDTETPNITNASTNNGQNKRIERTSGNIGVMSTQTMITEQRNIINISLQKIIIDDFKREFCIAVY